MTNRNFIGKGEVKAVLILGKLFPSKPIQIQAPISSLIPKSQSKFLGEEYYKHKHDIVFWTQNQEHCVVCEVNLKHGSIAHKKWNNVYKPHLEACKILTMTIDDNECTSLFNQPSNDGSYPIPTWSDYIDVINALNEHNIPI
jgi:hypothetical protein